MVCVAWQPLPLQHHFCHTHTTVTVIGGTAKQLLGSSTDWCATTIVTPHTRGATSTHTHTWMGKWCGEAIVLRLLCSSTLCMVTSLCHAICVCHLISQVCVTIHSITPLLFYHSPLFGVHVWHCQVAFTLSLWLLMHWRWHLCSSYGAHHASHPPLPVCVVMAFLHCPASVNHLPPFLVCFLVCSSSHCFNLH